MRYIIVLCWLYLTSVAHASGITQGYQEGAQTGNHAATQADNIIRQFNPETELSNYTANPREAGYHTGTEQSFNNISAEGARAAQHSDAGKAIFQSFDERPLYRVNHQEQGMQRAKIISDNAAHIAQGISNAYVDCQQLRECRTSYTEQTCQESGGLGEVTCMRDLVVQAIPQLRVSQTVTVRTEGGRANWRGQFGGRYESQFVVDLKTGHVSARLPPQVKVSVTPTLKPHPCEQPAVNFTVQPLTPRGTRPTVTMTQVPSCHNGFQAGFKVIGIGRPFSPFGAIITVTLQGTPPPEIHDNWVNGCQQLEARQCTQLETQCTKPNETRTINTLPITRPCWQERIRYRCGLLQQNTCNPLRDRGCEQMGSRCIEQHGTQCIRYEQTFRCPKETCNGNIGVICNNSKFCLQGDCTQAKPIPYDPNQMAKDISALSGAADASKQFEANFIFKGRRQACRKISFGFLDCCADRGWGRDAGLARCSNEEKELGHNKEKKLVIAAGEYCSRRILGMCIQRSRTYCTFQSKLSKIIQEQGRIHQLGISIGGGEHPNCRGLYPEELQRIDFDKIDFTDFYDDLRSKIKLPNEAQVNQRIREAIQRQQQSGRERP